MASIAECTALCKCKEVMRIQFVADAVVFYIALNAIVLLEIGRWPYYFRTFNLAINAATARTL